MTGEEITVIRGYCKVHVHESLMSDNLFNHPAKSRKGDRDIWYILSIIVRTMLFGLLFYANVAVAENQSQHEFQFTRGMYSDEFRVGDELGGSWSIDYPKADQHFLYALERLSIVDSSPDEYAVELTDPQLRDLPFVYALEVGSMQLTDSEAVALREYLLAGGFLFIDDFWGSWAWTSFAEQMQRVFPNREIVELPVEHALFNVVFDINEIQQVPNLYNGIEFENTGITHEADGREARVRGIFDDEDRLMVIINWNTDLGDAWEWADNPQYPSHFSTYAVKLGVNILMYAMTH